MKKLMLTKLLLTLSVFSPALSAQPAAEGDNRRPGDGTPINQVHPSWTLEQARPDDYKPQVGALAFSPDGKYLAICNFKPGQTGEKVEKNGTLEIIENAGSQDASTMKFHKVSDELVLPLGACWLEDGLYVLDRFEVTKWTDTDGDGLPDKRQSFASGWISDNFHHFSFGLPYHDGYFYATLSTSLHLSKEERETLKAGEGLAGRISDDKNTLGGNAPNPEHRGCVLKINAKTGEVQYIAGGLRTPNGIGIGPRGIVLAPDNQGDWKPSDGIYAVKGGEFLGKYNCTASHINMPDGGVPSLFSEKEPTPPAVWLPHNEVGNSPSAILLIPEGKPFAGQMYLADLTQGAIHRLFMQEVDGTWQGGVVRHTMGLEVGPNRIAWGPDGCLYVGGLGAGGGGGWGWGTTLFGLQRLRPTGKTAFEFEEVSATADGFKISFTGAVPREQLEKIENWQVTGYTYKPSPHYGGPKRDEYTLKPTRITVANDRKSVELSIDDRRPNFVYHLRIDATNDAGEKMWSPEAWFTFHKAPAR